MLDVEELGRRRSSTWRDSGPIDHQHQLDLKGQQYVSSDFRRWPHFALILKRQRSSRWHRIPFMDGEHMLVAVR